MAITQPGAKHKKPGQGVAEDEGEESDEYEMPNEEDEEESEEGDSDEEEGGGLTAMLLGENTGEGENYEEEDEGWVPAGGKEPADYSGDESEDEDDQAEPAGTQTEKLAGKTLNGAAPLGGKKRSRENDSTEDESREEKKVKLPSDPTH